MATLRGLAQACAALHYNEVELAYLKQALEAAPNDIEVSRHCAVELARMGQFDQAIACWHRIETIRPADKEAHQMIDQLQQEKLKYPGGRPPVSAKVETGRAQFSSADSAKLSQSPNDAPDVVLSPRQQLESAIANDPHDLANYLELAKLLVDDERYCEAEGLLNRAMAACGENAIVAERLRQIESLRTQHEVDIAEAQRKEIERQNRPFRMPWLELGLALAAVALVLQLFPPVAAASWKIVDFRHWSRAGWFAANIAALLILSVIRFIPALLRSRGNRPRRACECPVIKNPNNAISGCAQLPWAREFQ